MSNSINWPSLNEKERLSLEQKETSFHLRYKKTYIQARRQEDQKTLSTVRHYGMDGWIEKTFLARLFSSSIA
jgi:hypothetical protein